MKILFISQFAGSPELGMVTRNYNWGIELQKRGHDVTIIAASYSHYRNGHPEMPGLSFKEEIIDGLRYMWLKTSVYNGNQTFGRLRAMVEFLMRLRKAFCKEKADYDLVIASSPHPFQIYQAKSFAKKCGARLIYDVRDLWPLTLKTIGQISQWHPFIIALQYAEDYACRHADLVTSVPHNAENYFVGRGLAPEKFLAIGNGYILQHANYHESLPEGYLDVLKGLKNQNKLIIGYCGTLGRANAMHSAIQAIKQSNKKVNLVIIGDGHQKETLKNLSHSLNVDSRVHFLSPVPHKQVRDFLSYIDAAYIGTLYSDLYQYGASPAKMNDYMAASKPIIYAIGDPNNPVEQSGCGIACRAEDTDQIAQAMTSMSKMSAEDLQAMGLKGREWLLENQTVEKQIEQILKKLEK